MVIRSVAPVDPSGAIAPSRFEVREADASSLPERSVMVRFASAASSSADLEVRPPSAW